MSNDSLSTIVVAMFGGGALASVITTLAQRRKVGADATAVVTAAARELVDPLRRELANERAEHAAEIDVERKKVAGVRNELDQAMKEAQALRSELVAVRHEMDELRRENDAYHAKFGPLH